MIDRDLTNPRSNLKQQTVDIRVRPVVTTDHLDNFPSNDLVRRKINVFRFVDNPLGDLAVEPASEIFPELLPLHAEVGVDSITALFDLVEERNQIARVMLKVIIH